MQFVKPFSEIGKDDAPIAGGKGASLGEMTQAGIPVPPGFVILADSFERFLQETDLIQEIDTVFHSVEHDKIHTVDLASQKIRELILHAKMPEDIAEEIRGSFEKLDAQYVAVRSSATAEDGMDHAWAGQLESYLNTTKDDLLEKVQLCWSSLFTPRAIFYRFEKGLHGTKISVAVVVQKMVQSEVSGIAFSVHPVTEDYNQLIIESGFGLGEAIVSGSVTPDSFVVEKVPRRIIDTNIAYQSKALWKGENGGNEWHDLAEAEGGKPSMIEAQVLELSELILHIEKHYGFPCDIEWAFEAGKFYIVQSRPITTLKPLPSKDATSRTSHYFTEPMIKMGEWSLMPADMETWYVQDVTKHFEDFFGFPKCHPNIYIAKTDVTSNYAPESFFPKLFNYIHELTKEDCKGLEKKLDVFAGIKEKSKKELASLSSKDFSILPNSELIDLYKKNRDIIHYIVIFDHFGMYAENYWPPLMKDILVKKIGLTPDTPEYHDVLFTLSKPKEISTSLEEKRAVIGKAIQVVTKNETIDEAAQGLADDFGWLPVFTYGTPWDKGHYQEELSLLCQRDIAWLQEEFEKLEKYTELRADSIQKLVTKYSLSERDLQVFVDFGIAVDVRNEAEFVVSFAGFYLLPMYTEMAKRLHISEKQLRLLFEAEIISCLEGSSDPTQLLEEKKNIVGWGFDQDMRVRINYTEAEAQELYTYLEAHAKISGQGEGNSKKGTCASSGKAKGVARILKSPKDNANVKLGDILVSYSTTVDYLPAMKNASAIVTETGGLTCHAAVVSREFNIPCIVGLKGALTDFKDGDLVEVDADKGVVRVLEQALIVSQDTTEAPEDPLVLLGVWNTYPFDLWGWYGETAIERLRRLTGVQVRTFLYMQNELNYQCVFKSGLDELRAELEKRTSLQEKVSYITAIYDDYNRGALQLEECIQQAELLTPSDLSNEALANGIEERAEAWCGITMQIWYAVFLDIWYPGQEDQREIKAIAAKARDHTGHLHAQMYKVDELVHHEVAKRLNISPFAVAYLFPYEIADALRTGTRYDTQVTARMKFCVIESVAGGELRIHDGDEAKKLVERYNPPAFGSSAQTKLEGVIASHGKVTGRARVILLDKEFNKFQDGEILVALQTMVHYLPIMKKSSAILTEFGGLTSHAAIVSRELGKPAVVGIKNLIASVHDGDLVEVDADNGVVRIIEKTKSDNS